MLWSAVCLGSVLVFAVVTVSPAYADEDADEHAEHAVQYTCGMHPMIVVDEPGLCPICQMDLTPLKPWGGGAGTGNQIIEIDPVTVQKMGIRTALVERKTLARTIHTVGVAIFNVIF